MPGAARTFDAALVESGGGGASPSRRMPAGSGWIDRLKPPPGMKQEARATFLKAAEAIPKEDHALQ